jgi:single-strand DNA-binding protein
VVAWSKLAEICSQLLYKGRKIYCEGRLQTRRFTGQDGQERQVTEIVMEDMIALGAPKAGYGQTGGDEYGSDAGGAGEMPMAVSEPAPVAEVTQTPEPKKASGRGSKVASDNQQDVDVDDIPF